MWSYYLIYCVMQGQGTFIYEGTSYNVRAGEGFIIHPYKVVSYYPDKNDPWSYAWIGFNGILAARFDEFDHPVLRLKRSLFWEMLACENLENMREEYLVSKLFLLYSAAFLDHSPQSDYVRQACDYIDANYTRDIKIYDICRMLGVDRTYLFRAFKKKMGISMQQYLIQTRLSRAKQMLQQGYRVSETSAAAGYNDIFNFSKTFKKKYGLSPLQYKKRHEFVKSMPELPYDLLSS